MQLLGYRAFVTELVKIATEVRDPDIRAMIAEANGKEYLQGGRLATNTEIETNFKPKLAVSYQWLKGHVARGAASASDARLGKFTSNMKNLSNTASSEPIQGQAGLAAEYGKRMLTNRKIESHFSKTAGFMGYTPPSAYNWRGKKPTGQGTAYETGSNFASTALKGGMTGAGAATLAHTLRHGHDLKIAPRHLGAAVALGGGVALADRAMRRNSVIKQQQMRKTAMLNSETFTPARQLHASQERGTFENKLHHAAVKPTAGIIGRNFRLPQGA